MAADGRRDGYKWAGRVYDPATAKAILSGVTVSTLDGRHRMVMWRPPTLSECVHAHLTGGRRESAGEWWDRIGASDEQRENRSYLQGFLDGARQRLDWREAQDEERYG
jgi:hypothetical protein